MGKQNEWTPRLMDNLNKLSLNFSNIGNNASSLCSFSGKTLTKNKLEIKRKKTLNETKLPQTTQLYCLRNRNIQETNVHSSNIRKPILRNLRSSKRKSVTVMDEVNVKNKKKRVKP